MQISSVEWFDNTKQSFIVFCLPDYPGGSTQISVPKDENNRDYQQIQQWLQINGNVVTGPPVVGTFVPTTISARQFYQQLSIQFPNLITQDEAYAAATSGALPDFIVSIIKQIPQSAQFDAKMKIGSVVELQRNNPTTELFATLMGWTDAQTDQFFIDAGNLL